jgi:hypothetical protein
MSVLHDGHQILPRIPTIQPLRLCRHPDSPLFNPPVLFHFFSLSNMDITPSGRQKTRHDTSGFAVENISRRRETSGKRTYPGAITLYITCGSGGGHIPSKNVEVPVSTVYRQNRN